MDWNFVDMAEYAGGCLATITCIGLVLLAFDACRDTFPPMTDEEREDMTIW